MQLVNRISGALLVLVRMHVGYYCLYELCLFSATTAAQVHPHDGVIAVAGYLQGALVDRCISRRLASAAVTLPPRTSKALL
ncbi:hypothetical protein DIJ64_08690 [Mycobacterium leprae]|uniref:Uncharacterized protein n=1 Tax=Mycobacterium leprae TaxID=1769 RepID=A0AAD2JDP2_MYCLR|nr:hypothetical protein [Mycobacterium leprae]AWV48107.1 hypothetical protein DIJ64_08690 [Mycobacterium leprae]OAR21611.1 hypothetical protein A8144_04960 [Mycobacterium leprae 3125609]OAX71768.1 hypothetical protein A3216_03690 [Mycobacterium leprae 7935681]